LQIEVVNQKSSGDRAREELRLSQRVIGQVCQLSLCYAANASLDKAQGRGSEKRRLT
jgi:hypothetical protein